MADWSTGTTATGSPIRRAHCFLPGYRRSLCKKRLVTDDLVPLSEGFELCVACSREAGLRGIRLPTAVPVPGELYWAVPARAHTSHAFVIGQRRSLCGRYHAADGPSGDSAQTERCAPCGRKALARVS